MRRVSRVFQSPSTVGEGPDYLNAAVLLETALPAAELRRRLKSLESRLGRTRERRAAVAIDLDLCIVTSSEAGPTPSAEPPAPATLTQAYVAVPLADLAPDLVHPRGGETLARIASRLAEDAPLSVRNDVDLSRELTREYPAPRNPRTGRSH